jgi:hypothetical protein
MERSGHENISFFTGIEVEKTPAFGQKTLFVVGKQNPKEILARALNNNCPHIYLGANMSFAPDHTDADSAEWDHMIMSLVKAGVWTTLDFDVADVEWVLECGATEYNNFIPQISVKIPYISQLGYNATLKIDDKDFDATNPGVWVHSVHDLCDRKVFTDWTKYTKDETIN